MLIKTIYIFLLMLVSVCINASEFVLEASLNYSSKDNGELLFSIKNPSQKELKIYDFYNCEKKHIFKNHVFKLYKMEGDEWVLQRYNGIIVDRHGSTSDSQFFYILEPNETKSCIVELSSVFDMVPNTEYKVRFSMWNPAVGEQKKFGIVSEDLVFRFKHGSL